MACLFESANMFVLCGHLNALTLFMNVLARMENHHTELVDPSSQDTTFFPNDQWAYRLVASINQQLPNSQVKPPALVCYMVLFVSLTDHGN